MDAQPLQHIHSVAPGVSSRPVPSGISARRREKGTVDDHATNIVVYGETGVGKSHVINLIAGQELAHTSNEVVGCTFQHQRHNVKLDGMSFRNAYQRNYDLFYVTVCRKKVPVALVVTGLEHQQGEMETWWAANEDMLRQYGMLFDAHACVTTLVVENYLIQQRRSDSRRLLRELVLRYSILPPWKFDKSFISLVLPIFRPVLRRMMVADRTEQNTTIRRVGHLRYGVFQQ
ncbi:hypothetical protein J3R82DRAFT_7328 [Butyriboletus roseoflavus]|nr:hypothetical protein J3R82DRAFT_7328 [Butyriboletus roseoflavus]